MNPKSAIVAASIVGPWRNMNMPVDGRAARELLAEGHRAFRRTTDAGAREAEAQRPFAAIVGCSDARVPPEILFQRSPNELFVVRVAGNVLGEDVLGSLDYAIHHLEESLRLVVVLGHSGCGAITAAVDVYLKPINIEENIDSRSVRSLVHRLLLPVHAAAGALAQAFGPGVRERPGYRAALIELGVVTQAALAGFHLQEELDHAGLRHLDVAWGVYDLQSQRVGNPLSVLPPGGDDGQLQPAPRSGADFMPLRSSITTSAWVRDLLDGS